ncbi:MAG: DUF6314 family protein, partial [Pseudomonadota bacterium]
MVRQKGDSERGSEGPGWALGGALVRIGVPPLGALVGTWSVARRIRDHSALNSAGQGDGSFTGEAVWRPCEGAHLARLSSGGAWASGTGAFTQVLLQCERGILHLEGAAEMRAERRYLWRALGSEV